MNELAYLVQRYLLRRRFLTARSRLFDATFKVVAADFTGRRLYKHGAYEVGWFAVFFDRLAPEGAEVFAFEPDPLNFELLSHNLAVNGCRKVTPVKRAVSDSRRTSRLYLYPDKNRGRHSLVPSEGREVVDVEAITLDEFLGERAGRVRFMKMDIEGHEHAALAGDREPVERGWLASSQQQMDLVWKKPA